MLLCSIMSCMRFSHLHAIEMNGFLDSLCGIVCARLLMFAVISV